LSITISGFKNVCEGDHIYDIHVNDDFYFKL